jgi:C4-dicarboxylate-binding protein DctP
MTIKKYKIQFKIIFLFIFLIISCTSENESTSEIKENRPGIKSQIHLKFGHDMPAQSAQHVAALKYSEMVHTKTKGQVQIKVFPNQTLGSDQEMIAMARAGELDIILPPTAKLSTLLPASQIADLPFFFETRENIYSFLDGKPGKHLLKLLKPHGLIGATFWESGFKQFTANKEIRSPEDFTGLNTRAMKSKLIMDQFKMLHSNPIPIDFHKINQALKDGVIDAQENPLVSIAALNLYEHQSHVIISNHAYLGQIFCFSKISFEKLPEEIRGILLASAIEITPFERQEARINESQHLKEIRESGTNVITLTDQEKNKFRTALKPLIEMYRHDIGTNIVEMGLQVLEENREIADDEIIIGLDADLTGGSARSGLSIKRGLELAANEINQNGGVLGKSIRILSRDHSGISARGIDNFRHFSNIKNLVAVVGGLHSPVALSELEIIHKEKIIYLVPWAAATPIVENGYEPNFVFRVSVRDEFAGPVLVKEAFKKGKKNIALLLENTGWGRSNQKAMTDALKAEKKEPVIVEWFNWGEKDLTPQLKRIAATKAEIILLVANAPEGKAILETMNRESIFLPIISHWGITGGSFGKEFSEELSKIPFEFLQTYSFFTSKSKKNQKIIQKYSDQYQINHAREIIAPVGTAHAYDLIFLLATAINKVGDLDRPAIRDALEKIKSYKGLVKHYKPPFRPNQHDALSSDDLFLAKYDKRGNVIPISIKTSDLLN